MGRLDIVDEVLTSLSAAASSLEDFSDSIYCFLTAETTDLHLFRCGSTACRSSALLVTNV